MLSELQHFCLDAMNLTHGIPPKPTIRSKQEKPAIKAPLVALNNSSTSAKQTKKAPMNIKNIVANVLPEQIQAKTTIVTGLAPKELKNLDDWSVLQTAINACCYCNELSSSRSQTIFGQGSKNARLLIISEAPSSDEDIQGNPFVGKTGELLNNMLAAIHIKSEDTFITNIIKCLPPNNRDPHKEEALACQTFLNAQINAIKPQLILALGRIAAHNLLNVKTPVGQLRGALHQHADSQTDLIISYDPAYLIRNPAQKQKSWDDLKLVHKHLNLAEI